MTGATHTTGIECPSFGQKESETEMFKIADKVRVIVDNEKRLKELGVNGDPCFTGMIGTITEVGVGLDSGKLNYTVILDDFEKLGACCRGPYWFATRDLELVETDETVETEGADTHPIRTFDSGTTMTLKRFDDLVDYIVEKRIKAVMCAKSAEYAQGTNKLHNFDRAGEMRGITPMEALRGMKLKHEVSIQDMLDGLTQGKTYSRERWEEKFTDNINYQILEWAILVRDNGWDQPVDHTAPIEGGY